MHLDTLRLARSQKLLPPVLFAAAISAVYGRALGYGFAHDDFDLIRSFQDYSFWRGTETFWRPAWTFWLTIQYELFGFRPQPFHALSLLLHWVNACLAHRVLVAIGIRGSVATAGVCLWILLAGNAYAAVWISECNDLLAFFFLILATLFAVHYFKAEPARNIYWVMACLAWSLSMLSKEVALLWPLPAAGAAWLLTTGPAPGSRSIDRFIAIALPLMTLAALLSVRIYARGVAAGFWVGSGQEQVIVKVVRFVEGLVNNFLPLDIFRSASGLVFGALVATGLAACLYLKRSHLSRFERLVLRSCLCWTFLFSLHATMRPAPRTLYIPTLGLSIAICLLLMRRRGSSAGTRRACYAVFTVYLGMQLYLGNWVTQHFAPRSHDTLASSAARLESGNIGGTLLERDTDEKLQADRKAYLQRELRNVDVEALTREPYRFEPGWWRRLMGR